MFLFLLGVEGVRGEASGFAGVSTAVPESVWSLALQGQGGLGMMKSLLCPLQVPCQSPDAGLPGLRGLLAFLQELPPGPKGAPGQVTAQG